MTAESATRAGRRAAESLMVDTFAAYAPAAAGAQDDDTGLEGPAFTAQGSTAGKVSGRSRQGGDTNVRIVTIGGVERPVMEGGLHIPISSTVPSVGWEYECTAVGAASPADLVGRRWRVVDVPAKSFATARRLDVVEV